MTNWETKTLKEIEEIGLMACSHCKGRLNRAALAFAVSVFVFIASNAVSFAQNSSSFKLRILPKDCVFTVINAGTQNLLFLTPTICEPPPPPKTPGESSGSGAEEYRETIENIDKPATSPGQPELWTGIDPVRINSGEEVVKGNIKTALNELMDILVVLCIFVMIISSSYITGRLIESKYNGVMARALGIHHHNHLKFKF